EEIRQPVGKGLRNQLILEAWLKDAYPGLFALQSADLSVYQLVEQVVSSLGLLESAPAYSEALLQLALDHASDQNDGVAGFLYYWEQYGIKTSLRTSEKVDGVRLMTIHKAKGLEFPVVFVPVYYENNERGAKDPLPVAFSEPVYGLGRAIIPQGKSVGDEHVQEQFDQERERRLLDKLNTLYVATTRASNGLYMYMMDTKEPIKVSGQNRLSELLADYWQNEFEDEKDWRIGEIGQKQGQEPVKGDEVVSLPMSSFRLEGRATIAFEEEESSLSLSSKELGDEIHYLLSRCVSAQDLNSILRVHPWMKMDSADWDKVKSSVEQVVHHSDCEPWFSTDVDVFLEQEILFQGGVLRPDRVVEDDSTLTIIDFKTGTPDSKHQKQVQEYMRAFDTMTSKEVKGALVYTDPVEVVMVEGEKQGRLF
ncbi:MAG: 3'-5' exonuclease, partial [Bacteroidota bacterium]